jgi:imidazole glycerol-phosphate synthase subunit HisH
MIGIVNYGSGNIQAIGNIYKRLAVPFTVVTKPEELAGVDHVILPGVGAFDQTMGELNASGLRQALDQTVLEARKPILGICVGMQVLAKSSEEGSLPGLGWIDGAVKRFDHAAVGARTQLPHMGWNTVEPAGADGLFAGIEPELGYYFLHSYYFACREPSEVLATTDYGGRFSSAVRRDNIYGVQFHPEKSHQNGIRLLQNFARL